MGSAQQLLAQNTEKLFNKAAQLFLESVAGAIKDRGLAVVAVSGGSTPKKFFELLAGAYYAPRIDWPKLHIFWVDERCVPPQHPDSNFGMTQTALLSKVNIPIANIHRMPGEMVPPQDAAKAYENELKAFFKLTKSPPKFDFILLGVGADGHTASLFPKSEALKDLEHWVASAFVEGVNSYRLTLTFPVLNNARRILFLLSGASKAPILKQIMTSEQNQARYPVQMVMPESGEVIWLFDGEASQDLPPDLRFKALHI